jgi:hypothetical protein
MIPIVLAVLFVVGGILLYVALRNAQDFSDANEIIPGVPTNAPKQWAGAHSAEARLHRRLRDAMGSLRANAALDDPSLSGVRADLERHALEIDDHLVAVAALPKGHRDEPLQRVGRAVDVVEATVASLVALRGPALDGAARGIEDVRTRLSLIAAAREELAAFDPTADRDGDSGEPGRASP